MAKNETTCANLQELRTVIDNMTGGRRDTAEKLFVEIQFLENVLVMLREQVEKTGAIIKTARTVKENPAMKTYNVTIQRYSLLFKQIIDLIPQPVKEVPTDPLLDFVKGGSQLRLVGCEE